MNIIKNFVYSSKNDILDPLSVIIKLFLYSYKPIGTKISILNNKIIIQDNTFYQGGVRKLYGDSKNDINIMFLPIIYACEKYLNKENKKLYKPLFERALISFDKLK